MSNAGSRQIASRSTRSTFLARIAALILTTLAACYSTDYGHVGPYDYGDPAAGAVPSTVSTTDPLGDTFGATGVEWDLSALTVTRSPDGVIARLDFDNAVALPAEGDPDAMTGTLELDLDQNAATGHRAIVDGLRTDHGSTAMGVDAGVELGQVDADSTMLVVDAAGRATGRAKAAFGGHRITIRIPAALIGGDDGYVNAAVSVGNRRGATDFAPQNGNLALSAPPR